MIYTHNTFYDIIIKGATEVMEIGFSKVYVEVSAYHSEAVVILTNYR